MFYVRAWKEGNHVEIHENGQPHFANEQPQLTVPIQDLHGLIDALVKAEKHSSRSQHYLCFDSRGQEHNPDEN